MALAAAAILQLWLDLIAPVHLVELEVKWQQKEEEQTAAAAATTVGPALLRPVRPASTAVSMATEKAAVHRKWSSAEHEVEKKWNGNFDLQLQATTKIVLKKTNVQQFN